MWGGRLFCCLSRSKFRSNLSNEWQTEPHERFARFGDVLCNKDYKRAAPCDILAAMPYRVIDRNLRFAGGLYPYVNELIGSSVHWKSAVWIKAMNYFIIFLEVKFGRLNYLRPNDLRKRIALKIFWHLWKDEGFEGNERRFPSHRFGRIMSELFHTGTARAEGIL